MQYKMLKEACLDSPFSDIDSVYQDLHFSVGTDIWCTHVLVIVIITSNKLQKNKWVSWVQKLQKQTCCKIKLNSCHLKRFVQIA